VRNKPAQLPDTGKWSAPGCLSVLTALLEFSLGFAYRFIGIGPLASDEAEEVSGKRITFVVDYFQHFANHLLG
jgi:hypothetical protein